MKTPQVKFLHEEKGLLITSEPAGKVHLDVYVPWKPAYARLARKFAVNSVQLSEPTLRGHKTLDFLLDLPVLKRVHLIPPEPMDLRALERMPQLEYVGLMDRLIPRTPDSDADVPPVDFTSLTKLREAYVQICRPVESLLKCRTLQSLWLWNDEDQRVREMDLSALAEITNLEITAFPRLIELDLTAMPKLNRLHLEAVPKLQAGGIKLHPKAKLRTLKIGGCGAYRIDWSRMGNDLHDLEVLGPLKWPLEDVLRAPNLQRLKTNAVRKFPPLAFLRKFKHLEEFFVWATPPGPKWSPEDRSIIEEINQRSSR